MKNTKACIMVLSISVTLSANANSIEIDKIKEFNNEAIKKINTFNYKNIEKQLNDKKDYFTDNGWNQYLLSLNESKIVNTIETYEMSMKTVHLGTVRILSMENSYYDILTPIKTEYRSDNKKEKVIIMTHGVIFMKIINDNNNFKIQSYQLIETEN